MSEPNSPVAEAVEMSCAREIFSHLEASAAALRDQIHLLEERRKLCEEEGRFLEAQEIVLELKKLQIREGNRRRLCMQEAYQREREIILREQEQEYQHILDEWNLRQAEFEEALRTELDAVKQRQELTLRDEETKFFQRVANVRIRYSKEVLNLRSVLDRLIQSKQYSQAEEIKHELKALEQRDESQFEVEKRKKFIKAVEGVQKQQVVELAALRARQDRERGEFEKERDRQLAKLAKRHRNSLNDLEGTQRVEISKAVDVLNRKSQVLLSSPTKTSMAMESFPISEINSSLRGARRSSSSASPRIAVDLLLSPKSLESNPFLYKRSIMRRDASEDRVNSSYPNSSTSPTARKDSKSHSPSVGKSLVSSPVRHKAEELDAIVRSRPSPIRIASSSPSNRALTATTSTPNSSSPDFKRTDLVNDDSLPPVETLNLTT